MEFLKKNYRYILFFFFILFIVFILLYLDNTYDVLWEYGMSHAIRMGEVPYRDFNTVSTPLFIMLFSVGLFIYDSFAIHLLEFCLLYTFLHYLLYRLLGKNSIWVVLTLCVFLFHGFLATYNAMTFVVMVLLMVLEKEKKSDFWIGVVLGLLILSKHTIGLPVFFLTCIGVRDFKRILKRVNGCIIPGLLFLLYLAVTKSLISFFDLCIFGLFDFGNSNHLLINWCAILAILVVLVLIYQLWKDSHNIMLYYALGAFFFAFPMCELSHIVFFVAIFCISILLKYGEKIPFRILPYLLVGVFLILNILLRWNQMINITFSPFHHFEGTFTYQKSIPMMNKIMEDMNTHEKSIIIDGTGMFFSIISNKKIDYFGVPLHGNYGYKGSEKMIKKISKMHDTYFYVDYRYYNNIISGKNLDDTQFDVDIVGYVIEKGEEVGKVGLFTIYYFE